MEKSELTPVSDDSDIANESDESDEVADISCEELSNDETPDTRRYLSSINELNSENLTADLSNREAINYSTAITDNENNNLDENFNQPELNHNISSTERSSEGLNPACDRDIPVNPPLDESLSQNLCISDGTPSKLSLDVKIASESGANGGEKVTLANERLLSIRDEYNRQLGGLNESGNADTSALSVDDCSFVTAPLMDTTVADISSGMENVSDNDEVNDAMSDVSSSSHASSKHPENEPRGTSSLPMDVEMENISDVEDEDVDAALDANPDAPSNKRLSGGLHDDHVELDYEEEIVDDSSRKNDVKHIVTGPIEGEPISDDDEGEIKESKDDSGAKSDEGEIDDDDDCEEGEIKEPGGKTVTQVNICRFYLRGNCTWGINCRYKHPGVTDRGNYQMIEHPLMGMGRGRPGPWTREVTNSSEPLPPLPPPPVPDEPAVESAWERGVRHSKEIMKKASERRETDPYFEEKRLNMKLDEETSTESGSRVPSSYKDPYYDDIIEERYYEKSPTHHAPGPPPPIGPPIPPYEGYDHPPLPHHAPPHWMRGPYPPPHIPHGLPGPDYHFHSDHGPPRGGDWAHRQRSVSPPVRVERRVHRKHRHSRRHRSHHDPARRGEDPSRRPDEWHDPWRRSKSPTGKRLASGSRSLSPSRRRRSLSRSSYSSSRSSRSWSSSRSSASSYTRSSSSSSRSFSRSRSKSASPTRYPPLPSAAPPPSSISQPQQSGPAGPRSQPQTSRSQQPPVTITLPPRTVLPVNPLPPDPFEKPLGSKLPPLDVSIRPTTSQSSTTPLSEAPKGRGYYPQPPPSIAAKQPPHNVPPIPTLREEPVRYPQKREPAPLAANAKKPQATPVSLPPPHQPIINRPSPRERKRRRTGSVSSSDRSSRSKSSSDSRTRSRSRSGSSASSASSRSSSSSADSEHLYRDIGSPPLNRPMPGGPRDARKIKRPRTPIAMQQRKGPFGYRRFYHESRGMGMRGRGRMRHDGRSDLGPPRRGHFIPRGRDRYRIIPSYKPGIKLTLVNKSFEKNGIPPKRRNSPMDSGPPPRKRQIGSAVKRPDSKALPEQNERIHSPVSPRDRRPLSPVRSNRPPGRQPPAPAPSKQPTKSPVSSAAGDGSKAPGKKNTVLRREYLLKQLKAVEDAIERKRAKLS